MSCPILPKGFIDHRGSYLIKHKLTHRDLLNVREVAGWNDMRNMRLENADKYEKKIIAKELAKLEQK